MEKTIKQGDKKFKAGKQNVTTGIFQWSKDYSSAASNFSQALKCYNSANAFKKSLETIKELIICNEKLLDNWAVARNYEEMLDIYLKNFPETTIEILKDTANKGLQFFRMSQSTDKGLQMLGRLAKELSNRGQKKEGVQVLKRAYQFSVQDQKSFKKKELFHQIIQVFLQADAFVEVQKMYKELIQREKGSDSQQNCLVILIMILLQHEAKRAEKEMYELSSIVSHFLQTDECEAGDELIKAYKKGNQEAFMKWTTKAAITSIFPVIIIKKLRELKVPAAQAVEQSNQNKEEQQAQLGQLLF